MLAFGNNVSCSSNACATPAFCRRLPWNLEVNTLASKRSLVDRKRSDCSIAPRNPQHFYLCVPASSSCLVLCRNAGTQGRPVASLTHWILDICSAAFCHGLSILATKRKFGGHKIAFSNLTISV